MPTPRPLTDPATRIELRDAATCAWHECSEDDSPRVRARHVAQYLRSLGYLATVEVRPTASSFVTVNAISPTGSGEVLALVWEPHIDGFDYEESGEDADAIDGPPPDSMLVVDSHDDSRRVVVVESARIVCNNTIGESPSPAEPAKTRYRVFFTDTVEAATEEEAYDIILSYLAECVRYRDITAFNFSTGSTPEAEPETATCDGCENAFPVDEVEIMGNADHGPFGFCAKCREP